MRFNNVRKAFLPRLRGKEIAVTLWFLGGENQNSCKKIQKIAKFVLPLLYGKIFESKIFWILFKRIRVALAKAIIVSWLMIW